MFGDNTKTLKPAENKDIGAPNFLLALGLCCYTEYWGKLKCGIAQNKSQKSFEAFLVELDKSYYEPIKSQIYRDVRCGLAHAYMIENRSSAIDALNEGPHGSQSRGTGASDDEIAHLGLIYRVVEAKTVRNFLLTRIPKYHLATANHHWYFAGCEMKTVQHILYVGVKFEVYVGVWMSIPHQKLFNSKRISRIYRANKNNVSNTSG